MDTKTITRTREYEQREEYIPRNWAEVYAHVCEDCRQAIKTHTHGGDVWFVTADAHKRPRFLHRVDLSTNRCDCEAGRFKGNCKFHIPQAVRAARRLAVEQHVLAQVLIVMAARAEYPRVVWSNGVELFAEPVEDEAGTVAGDLVIGRHVEHTVDCALVKLFG